MLHRIARLLPYLLYLFLISLHQTLLGDTLSLWGADLASGALAIMLVAIHKPQSVAVWFGSAVAFLLATGDSGAAATGMVVAAGLAIGAEYFKGRLNLESLAARLAVVSVGCLLIELINAAFFSGSDLLYTWFRYTIPSVIYTSGWGLLFFLFKDGIISRARLRRLF